MSHINEENTCCFFFQRKHHLEELNVFSHSPNGTITFFQIASYSRNVPFNMYLI